MHDNSLTPAYNRAQRFRDMPRQGQHLAVVCGMAEMSFSIFVNPHSCGSTAREMRQRFSGTHVAAGRGLGCGAMRRERAGKF